MELLFNPHCCRNMKNINNERRISKFLSLVLRHRPEKIGITLDEAGWTPVTDLLAKINYSGLTIDLETLKAVVKNNQKQRFSFDETMENIRANQGHSVKVNLGYQAKIPPNILYHGTTIRFRTSILSEGLKKMNRHHVHLSANTTTATSVGIRHGKLMLLEVLAGDMQSDGFTFFESENGVWLTDHVPVKYLRET